MLISFVLPVYNVREYLEECFESIADQIDGRSEILLVDDGSTDGSGTLADELAARTSGSVNARVIHKSNGGLASARNAGYDAARGEYIAFVDSDDRIAAGSYQKIASYASSRKRDVIFLDAIKFYPDGSIAPIGYKVEPCMVDGRNRLECLEHLARLPKFPESAWAKLYRRDFLEDNHLRFPEDGRYSEDLGYVLRSLMLADSFGAVGTPYYEYRQNRDGSITNSVGSKHFNSLKTFVLESCAYLTHKPSHPKDEACSYALSFVAYEYSIMLWMLSKLDEDERAKGIEFLKEYRWVMTFAKGKKARATEVALKVLGVGGASLLLDMYMNFRSR